MLPVLRFLPALRREIQPDLHPKLSIARFGDFEWSGGFDGAAGVGVGVVQLELDFFQPGRDVRAVGERADVDFPAFGVAFGGVWEGGVGELDGGVAD